MENKQQPIGALVEKAGDYAKMRVELIKLQSIQASSEVSSSLLSGFIITILVMLCLIFLSIALAIWIGIYTGNPLLGFLYIGGFYLLICIAVLVFRKKWLQHPIQNYFIKKLIPYQLI